MLNSYILTADGVSGLAFGQPFTVSNTHPNYPKIIGLLKNKIFDGIMDLINISRQIINYINTSTGRIEVDVKAGIVLFQGMEIHNVVTDQIINQMQDGFDVGPVVKLLDNMLENPSRDAIPRLYDWMEAGKMPISENGCFIAFKRVSDDYTSFYDGKTMHAVGQITEMPREQCDNDQNNTCSTGLHFCSQGFLPSYMGGQGRILVLEINPRDVTAIPIEYGTHKGRCCRYKVIGELTNDYRARVETEQPIRQSVITSTTDFGATTKFIAGYDAGYLDGRKQQYTWLDWLPARGDAGEAIALFTQHEQGYVIGHKDGRGHKARQYKL